MKIRRLVLLASLLTLVFPGARGAPPVASGKGTPPARPGAAPNPEASLKPAMPAEMVRQIMGPPDAINPMKTKIQTGRAEIWVYRRKLNEHFERVEIGSIPINTMVAGADGQFRQQTIDQTPQYSYVRVVTEETVELLMFNDQFITAKASRRTLRNYK